MASSKRGRDKRLAITLAHIDWIKQQFTTIRTRNTDSLSNQSMFADIKKRFENITENANRKCSINEIQKIYQTYLQEQILGPQEFAKQKKLC